jgi:hypothetical protein
VRTGITAINASNGYIQQESGVNNGHWLRKFKIIGLIFAFGGSMSAQAGFLGFGGTNWKEEVLLHDGSKIIVERSISLGGRHEIGQELPIKEQSLTFVMPSTNQRVSWTDEFSEDIGTASFLPMQLEIVKNTAYLVVNPMGCLSYNKWGRPNPPYVIFKYQGKEWQRISLQELPPELKQINLAFSSPDHAAKEARHGLLSAEQINKWNSDAQQPEYRIILREPIPAGGQGRCPKLVYYKGAWVGSGDSTGRWMMDHQ